MRRIKAFSIVCLLLVGLLVDIGSALADPPDILTS